MAARFSGCPQELSFGGADSVYSAAGLQASGLAVSRRGEADALATAAGDAPPAESLKAPGAAAGAGTVR